MKHEDKQLRLEKLNALLERLNKQPAVQNWKKYQAMQPAEQQVLEVMWDEYFQDVKQTRAYRCYLKMRELLKKGKMGELQAYVQKAEEQLTGGDYEIPKPPLDDPKYLRQNQDVVTYQKITQEINELSGLTGEFATFGL